MNHWPMLSRPADNPVLRVISHGGGVQTSALCLMAARGDIGPMADMAIMADTGHEPRKVYEYLDWLRGQVPFPIVMVRRPGMTLGEATAAVAAGTRPKSGTQLPPLYTSPPKGMLPKHCSREFKTRPVTAHIRELLGLKPRQRAPKGTQVEVWLGISKDEIQRVKTSETPLLHYRHPLVEMDMTRAGCLKWMAERQYRIPVKSSCIFCPLRDNAAWANMQENESEDFAEAVQWDRAFRAGWPGMEGQAFVHRSFVPLDQADFRQQDDSGQLDFLRECDSCGL